MIPDFLKRMLGCYEARRLDVIDHGDSDFAWPAKLFRTPIGTSLPAGAYRIAGNGERIDPGTNRNVLSQIGDFDWEGVEKAVTE